MALLKEITVSLGMSIDKNGLWVKPGMSLRVELSEQDQDPANRRAVVQRVFEILEEDLNEEIGRLLSE